MSEQNGYKSGSNLEKVLKNGHFAVTAELGPPKNADAEVVRKKASILKGFVDAANITDNQTAIVRMSSIAAGTIALQAGLEPVMQMTCRDRNRLGMQSDLLGAYALGLRNILCLTGDHQTFGNHPQSKNVHDIDSLQLVQMVVGLRDQACFQCGEEIKGTNPRFFVGAAENPFGDPFEWRPYRLGKKAKAGANFIQTQMIFNVPKFREFMKRVVDLGVHQQVSILAGIGPLKTPGAAKYMRDQVPGMDVPNEIVERMEAAGKGIEDKKAKAAAFKDEGLKICIEMIQQMREIEGVAGVHLMAIEWEEAVPILTGKAGLLPRPVFNEN
ncbi:MAG TPA: methylenetetrahydrofolate reductase [Anaerolineae bacterium]|nr:methylenetetrahydrofolate reductase [Anaerolineae bacterium]